MRGSTGNMARSSSGIVSFFMTAAKFPRVVPRPRRVVEVTPRFRAADPYRRTEKNAKLWEWLFVSSFSCLAFVSPLKHSLYLHSLCTFYFLGVTGVTGVTTFVSILRPQLVRRLYSRPRAFPDPVDGSGNRAFARVLEVRNQP